MTKCGVIWESALEMWEEHHTWDSSGKVLWRKRHLSPTLKDGILTGGDGRERNILVFPEWLGFLDPETLQWLGGGTTRFCPLSYESRWTVFTRNNLFLHILENILPEWVRLICWTQTWPACCLPYFSYSWEKSGTPGSRAVSLAPLKSQAQKRAKNKN